MFYSVTPEEAFGINRDADNGLRVAIDIRATFKPEDWQALLATRATIVDRLRQRWLIDNHRRSMPLPVFLWLRASRSAA